MVVSSALADHLVQRHDVERDKLTVVPNAINPGKTKSDSEHVEELRNRYELHKTHVVGFVGAVLPWHGVDLLVRAMHHVLKEGGDLKLIIVGDGSALPEIKNLQDSLGLDDHVVFTGRVPHEEVFNFIEVMDIAVMPSSNWYGSPVKIFEYGAMGKPIIAPDNGPVNEVMENGTDGVLVEPNPVPLAEAIQSLMDDSVYRERLGSHFQEKVLTQHTWRQNASEILETLA